MHILISREGACLKTELRPYAMPAKKLARQADWVNKSYQMRLSVKSSVVRLHGRLARQADWVNKSYQMRLSVKSSVVRLHGRLARQAGWVN
jgi:hypothetical protein